MIMAHDLFRVTVDEPNYSNLLGSPLTEEEKALLPNDFKTMSGIRLWAINETSPAANEYHRFMEEEDGLLFYKVQRGLAPDEKRYTGVGRISEKFETDAGTARELFQTPTATLMFTVDDFSSIEVTIEDLEEILGYKQHPQRTQRVKPNRYSTVESVFRRLPE